MSDVRLERLEYGARRCTLCEDPNVCQSCPAQKALREYKAALSDAVANARKIFAAYPLIYPPQADAAAQLITEIEFLPQGIPVVEQCAQEAQSYITLNTGDLTLAKLVANAIRALKDTTP